MGKISAFFAMPHPPIIIPEVGQGEEEKIRNTYDACHKVSEEIAIIKPDTIIIVTPHGPVFKDAIALSYENNIYGDLKKFRAKDVSLNLEIDRDLSKKIIDCAQKENISIAKITNDSAYKYNINYELDHGSIVPLYFIGKLYSDYKIVHITYGMLPKLDLYKFGMCIKEAVENSDSNTVFIASGDLSHKLLHKGPYEYSPYGEKFDKELVSLLKKGDKLGVFNIDPLTIKEAGECGLRSYYIMLGAMDGFSVQSDLLSYEAPFGVGYMVMKFSLEKADEDTYKELIDDMENRYNKKLNNEDNYVRLARESLTHYLMHGDYLEMPSFVTEEMKSIKRSVFVSLKEEGMLRGCIGTTMPTLDNVAEEIIKYAVEAGIHDPRFPSVTLDELKTIDFSVDVLTEPQKSSIDGLDPKIYGVIVRNEFKSGLLLPDLEGVNTLDKQLKIVLDKARIKPNEDYEIFRFKVIRHK